MTSTPCSPQTDMTGSPAALFEALARAPSVLLTGPVGADGDSLGATLALAHVLARHGVTADVTGATGRRYGFLPGAEDLLEDDAVAERAEASPWHTVVVMDGDRDRLPPGVERAWRAASVRAVVDHHKSTTTEGYDLAWIEPGATSTCHMLLAALRERGEALDPTLATLLHVGTVFDTGGFRFENTTPDVLRSAAELVEAGARHVDITTHVLMERSWSGLQALARVIAGARRLAGGRLAIGEIPRSLIEELDLAPEDLEGIVDRLLFTRDTQVAALLIERDGHIKVSLRSRGDVDVAALAARLSPTGGGHRKAAGARSELDRSAIEHHLLATLRD